jgi:hypothetical protein
MPSDLFDESHGKNTHRDDVRHRERDKQEQGDRLSCERKMIFKGFHHKLLMKINVWQQLSPADSFINVCAKS